METQKMEDKKFKPEYILDGDIIQIWSEPGIVIINSPAASLKIPEEDWPAVKESFKSLK